MRSRRWLAPTILALCSTNTFAGEQLSEAPRVPAPEESDPILSSDDRARSNQSLRTQSGIKLNVTSAARGHDAHPTAASIGTVNLTSALLSRPVDVRIETGVPIVAYGLPASLSVLELALDGKPYQLQFSHEATDGRTGLRHVIMTVLNDETAKARFTISQDGKAVYGTLRTGASTYIFEPTRQAGEQTIYRYFAGNAVNGSRGGVIGASQLARRHHQIEALGEIKPDYSFSSDEVAYMIGGELGTVRATTESAFVEAAQRLSAVTQFTGTERFQQVGVRSTQDGGRLATFKQLIDGVPFDAVNEMLVDRNGKLLRLATAIAPQGASHTVPVLSGADARRLAQTEWMARYGRTVPGVKVHAAVVAQYRYDRPTHTLLPYFSFEFEVPDESITFHADVDAVSGRVQLKELVSNNVSYTACEDFRGVLDPTLPKISACTPGRVVNGYAHPQQTGYCTQPSNYPANHSCNQGHKTNVYEVMNDIRNTVPAAVGGNAPGTPACCNEISNVVVLQRDTRISVSEASGWRINQPTSDILSPEILAHEMGHIYVNVYNDYLEVETNVFAGAVREGTASTFGGLVGAVAGRAGKTSLKRVDRTMAARS